MRLTRIAQHHVQDERGGQTANDRNQEGGGITRRICKPAAEERREERARRDQRVLQSNVRRTFRPGVKFERVAQYELGESCYASPAISDGQVFLRGFQHLFCLGRKAN